MTGKQPTDINHRLRKSCSEPVPVQKVLLATVISQPLLPSQVKRKEDEEGLGKSDYVGPRTAKVVAWVDNRDKTLASSSQDGSDPTVTQEPSWDPIANLSEELVSDRLRSLTDWSNDCQSVVEAPAAAPAPEKKPVVPEERAPSPLKNFFQIVQSRPLRRAFSPLGFSGVAVLEPGSGADVPPKKSWLPPCLRERVSPAATYCRGLVRRSLMLPMKKFAFHLAEIERRGDPAQDDVRVIHPFSCFRLYYVIFMIIVTILSLFITPVTMAFQDESNHFNAWIAINTLTDVFFLIDIFVNFKLGMFSEDQIFVMDPVKIKRRYLKTWFLPDLLSSVPLDIFWLLRLSAPHSDLTHRISKFTRLASVFRLLRIPKLARYFQEWEQLGTINVNYSELFYRIVCLFGITILMSHWNGCIQFFLASLQDFPENSWVAKGNLINQSLLEQYSVGVFRALSQMVGVGYGSSDPPKDLLEMWILIICIFSGSLVYVMILANVSAMVTNAEQATKKFREKIDHLTEYMAYRKLPPHLCKRIFDYYETRYQGKWFDEKEILNEISEPLKEEVQGHLCTNLVRKVPLFQDCDVNFVNAVIAGLHYELFLPDDVICQEGCFGDRMYFIEYGKVMVETKYFKKQLMDGDYFGEIAVLRKGFRVATVKALTLCSLYSLSAETFQEVFQAYPEMGEKVVNVAQKYLEQLQDYEETEQKETSA
ncbi:potassium/sodium hyperpolarization-activated cyclic nucleotide-gated channel 1-like isoform X2 [Rhinatrema bivittatum]|uniref:potassium/sodium hyperpolarization-activated cyclic nucleotide-gated channel 1-like isoform X2 n=1 Tax=Rhinatrema bivittatum TaxID=194408 RepID=UPI0011291687|nr:potassium/sodium hyperpolarization-activated cyclic nucleotide-gated channel 1-like isoform X2 [Rhinatrema bivittatum]